MIVSTISKSDIEETSLLKIIEGSVELGKCVEVYMKDDSMLYIQKTKARQYVYGYYYHNTNEEWMADSISVYAHSMVIEFVHEGLYKETKEFDISNCTKLYVGDEWSN